MSLPSQPWPEETTYAERWRAARRSADRCRARFLTLKNVISVGVGLKHTRVRGPGGQGGSYKRVITKGGTTIETKVVPCIHVVVSRKWKDRRCRKDSLPEWVTTYLKVKKKIRKVKVPVDVVEVRKSSLHMAYPSDCNATEIHLNLSIKGTAAAFVRMRNRPSQFLLGCHHVLALTKVARLPADGSLPAVDIRYLPGASGTLAYLPSDPDKCDAALATCYPEQSQISFNWNNNDTKLNDVLGSEDPPYPDLLILTPRGIKRATWDGITSLHGEWYYGGIQRLFFKHVLHSTISGGMRCSEGDSGSAVVTPDGRLVAMHYAGNPGRSADSYSIMAYDIFKAFPVPISLWP